MGKKRLFPVIPAVAAILAVLACSQLPSLTFNPPQAAVAPSQPAAESVLPATPAPAQAQPATAAPPTDTPAPTAEPPTAEPPTETPTATVVHVVTPLNNLDQGLIIYDVVSRDTAPQKRAPYGDSYQINRLERPFDKEMLYNDNLDIWTYNVIQDEAWVYVSIQLVGINPNDPLWIQYGVELDINHDGFGDYIVTALPPFQGYWDNSTVQVYQDTNRDTGGLSAEKSDAPLPGNGYDKLIFDKGQGSDPDLAWVRANVNERATLQFAIKKSLTGKAFMLGVVADAGFKNVGMMDYVDRYTRAEAGSPVRDNEDYPLKLLFNIDNACRSAYGFAPTGDEPQLCPKEPTPTAVPPGIVITPWIFQICQPPPTGCYHGYWNYVLCRCIEIPY